jgi:DNA-directed RNA polymerase subunit beta
MRDEDDDLLRAAEELGIDLSGVRAEGGPTDETTAEVGDEEAEEAEAESEEEPFGGGDLDETDLEIDLDAPLGEEDAPVVDEEALPEEAET